MARDVVSCLLVSGEDAKRLVDLLTERLNAGQNLVGAERSGGNGRLHFEVPDEPATEPAGGETEIERRRRQVG